MSITCLPDKRDAYFWQTYRNKVHITPELVAHVRDLSKQGKKAGEIADLIRWPQHKRLRMIIRWCEI